MRLHGQNLDAYPFIKLELNEQKKTDKSTKIKARKQYLY